MTNTKKRLALLLCVVLLLSFVPFVPVAHAATDGVVQASGEGVLNANRVNIRPAPSTKNTPLGKAGKGDVFRVTGFIIPRGFSQGFFQVEGGSITGSAYIAANYLNVTFDAPPTGEITKKGYLYTAKSTSRKNRAGSIAVGDTLPLYAREGKWWRTELNGQTLWAQAANVQTIQGASTPAAPASGIQLTPSTTKSTYGSLRVSVSGVEGASFVGWRRHTPGATYTDKAGFANITASQRFTATANGWYAVGVVDAQGQFHYEIIHITNIVEYPSGGESAPIPKTNVTFTAAQVGGASGTAYSTGITLTFSQAVTGLTAGDITIADGTGAAVKGALTGSGTTWTIALNDVTKAGNVNVRIADFGTFHATNNPQVVEVFQDTNIQRYTLTADVVTVCGSDSGSVSIQNAQTNYRSGMSVTVTATPTAPYEFLKWRDGDGLSVGNKISTLASYTFTINANTKLYAVFSVPQANLPTGVTISNAGVVTSGAGATGAIVIPSVVDGVAVTSIASDAFRNNSDMTSLTLPVGVTSIGNTAFRGCSSLESLTLPVGLQSIGEEAFRYCDVLQNVEIPASVTTLGPRAFGSNDELKTVTFLGNHNAGFSAEAFRGCIHLKNIYYLPANATSWEANAPSFTIDSQTTQNAEQKP